MKKSLFVFVFAVSLSASTVFADHPNGLGVGVQGSWNISWVGGGAGGASLSLKLPIIPVYWAVNMGFGVNNFSLGLSGDFYIIDSALVPAINLHWFGGLGGFFNMGGFGQDLWLSVGVRIPVGLSWQPIRFFEAYISIAPSLGLQVAPSFYFPAGGCPFEIGVRIWL